MTERGDRGRYLDPTVKLNAEEKPLKKKKSIFRSLSRSRKSKSRPASPEIVTSQETPPSIPKPRIVSTSSIGPEPESGQLKGWEPSPAQALSGLDNNVTRGQDNKGSNVRDSASTTSSQKAQNFSRHPRNRSGTNGSYEDLRPATRDTILPPPPPPPIEEQPALRPRELHHQYSHGAFQNRNGLQMSNSWAEISHKSEYRPFTAVADSRSGREIPSFLGPRINKQQNHPVDLEKSPRGLAADFSNHGSGREGELRASRVSTHSGGSTKNSSTFTKESYVSDTNTDLNDHDYEYDEMTVDDAIDLYAGGFEDDQKTPTEEIVNGRNNSAARHTKFFTHVNVENRATRIAEAMNDPLKPMLSVPKSLKPNHPTSAAIFGGEIFKSLYPEPPALQEATMTHDQYGFRKYSRDVSIAQYDSWHKNYATVQSRRNEKWVELMIDAGLSTRNPENFPPRSVKMQRYIRKGIPPSWRGSAWFFYAGGPEVLQKNPDKYADLLLEIQKGGLSEGDKESIERDLHRTFPDNIHFKPDKPEKLDNPNTTAEMPLLSALRRVLSAFAIHHPKIGYCQSLNFLAGLLLLFMTEERAFWTLHIITTRLLPGTHETSLEGANVDLWVLMLALKDALPAVWAKVGGESQSTPSRLPPISLCTTSWFMSIFIGTLPTETFLRVWDVLFYDGSVTIFRIAVAIFRLGEPEIKAVSEQMETFQVVQTIPRKILDVADLMGAAYRKNPVSAAWVEKKRKERKEWYAEERLAEKVRKQSKDVERPKSNMAGSGLSGAIDDDRIGRTRTTDLNRTKSTGFWAKRSQSLRRAKSAKPAKRSNTVKIRGL